MLGSRGFSGRLVSNFVVFPRHGLAEVNIEPGVKIVRLTAHENAQGSRAVASMSRLFYFFGPPKTIYRSYLNVRNEAGYRVDKPKYALFGVGWEAWGALEWNTNQASVTAHVERYLELGYPLAWMVIGSGFWPREDARFHATTSFGMWDRELYPEPRAMIEHFHQRGLKVLLGLRIAFITDGPYADEGVRAGRFITQDGEPRVFRIGFPRRPVYLLDAANPAAVEWYVSLCGKWLADGVDGFKEDLYGYGKYELPDDKIDAVNAALMERGVYVMGRNGYLGSPMELHRIEDFNFNSSQDRGPINGLCLAYAGLPNVYPCVVGGAPQEGGLKAMVSSRRARMYLMREAQFASVCSAMAFGLGPWLTQDEQVVEVTREAAKLHVRLQPYVYSAAVDASRTGFPYPMTPLPLAYPDDPAVYELANRDRRSYQWLIGESLLATPLYGDDYATANARDVYLPAGKWMDYDTGEVHEGPGTLKDFALPVGKTPLFVGGKGIIVERSIEDSRLRALVFPVAPADSTFRFTYPDGATTSTITNRTRIPGRGSIVVREATSGTEVDFKVDRKRGAVVFELTQGRGYELVSLQ